jgi:hypothetical protein
MLEAKAPCARRKKINQEKRRADRRTEIFRRKE